MIRKQVPQRVPILACIALVSACADGASPTGPAPDASLSAQRGQGRLAALFDQASPAVLAMGGAVFADIAQLCQTFVVNPGGATVVGPGDSGSPVFRITSGDNVQLVGILWGGSSDNRTFVYSPLKQIQDELGAVTATK